MDSPKNSAAKIKANAKYTAKAYDKCLVYLAKGKKVKLQDHATALNESLNGFINRAIDETVERDKVKKSN